MMGQMGLMGQMGQMEILIWVICLICPIGLISSLASAEVGAKIKKPALSSRLFYRGSFPLLYGVVLSTTYWKHVFGEPVVWK